MPGAGLGIVEHQVTLAEGAALGVLSGQTDGDAIGQGGGERERFGVRPVDAAVGIVEQFGTLVPGSLQLRIWREAVRNGVDRRPGVHGAAPAKRQCPLPRGVT